MAQNLTYSNITMTNIVYGAIVIYSYYNGRFGTPTSMSLRSRPRRRQLDSHDHPDLAQHHHQQCDRSRSPAEALRALSGDARRCPSPTSRCINVNISAPETFDIYNAQGIQLIDSQITVPGTTNTLNLYNAQVTVTNSAANTNLVTLGGLATPPTNNVLAFFNAQAAITDTNMLGAGPITLGGSTLTFNQGSVSFSNNLSVVSQPRQRGSTLAFTSGSNTFSGALSGPGPLTLNLTTSNSMLTLARRLLGLHGDARHHQQWHASFRPGHKHVGRRECRVRRRCVGNHQQPLDQNITILLGALSGGCWIETAGQRPSRSGRGHVRDRRPELEHDICRHDHQWNQRHHATHAWP